MKLSPALPVGFAGALVALLAFAGDAGSQEKGKGKGPAILSPEVKADRSIVFRILAPKAEKVTLNTSDIPSKYKPRDLTKAETGIWELTVGPVEPGTYRYVCEPHEEMGMKGTITVTAFP